MRRGVGRASEYKKGVGRRSVVTGHPPGWRSRTWSVVTDLVGGHGVVGHDLGRREQLPPGRARHGPVTAPSRPRHGPVTTRHGPTVPSRPRHGPEIARARRRRGGPWRAGRRSRGGSGYAAGDASPEFL